jgi:hypothetical protein
LRRVEPRAQDMRIRRIAVQRAAAIERTRLPGSWL